MHLGSARLSINGLNDGKMPMESDSGIIIYNGELFEINKLKNLIKDRPIHQTIQNIYLIY